MKTVPLRHVAEVRSSSVDKKSHDGESPVRLCNYMDVYRNDRVSPEMDLMVATATPEEVSRFRLASGDSIITKDSEDPNDIGVSAFVDSGAADFVCGYHLAIVRPKSGVFPRYLNWAIRGRQVLGHWTDQASGMTRYGLGLQGIKTAPIRLPDEVSQRRIADFLDDRVAGIDSIIAARRDQVVSLRELRVALADDSIPGHAWTRATTLRRFVRGIEQGWSPQCDGISAEPNEWGVLKVSAVKTGRFFPGENKRLPDELAPQSHYEIRPGDVLVTRANTPKMVGAFAVVPEDVRPHLILCDKIMRLDLAAEVAPAFVALVGSTRRAKDRLSAAGTGTSQSMVNIRAEDVKDLPFPRLAFDEQLSCVARFQSAQSAVSEREGQLKDSIDLLTEYKTALITAAVTGELDVTTAGSGIPA